MRGLTAITVFMAAASSALALPPSIERTVRPGQTVVLSSSTPYISDRSCIPLPKGDIDTSPKPRFGQVTSRSDVQTRNGPCGMMAYTRQTIQYVASQSGVDEFNLYYFFNTRTNGPEVSRVRIVVSGSAAAEKSPSSQGRISAPSPHVRAVSLQSSVAPSRDGISSARAGRYVNQLGNVIEVQRDMLFFTGTWNREGQQEAVCDSSADRDVAEMGELRLLRGQSQLSVHQPTQWRNSAVPTAAMNVVAF